MELLARVLAASIRFHEGSPTRLIACVPEDSEPLSYNTRTIFDECSVPIRTFTPILKGQFNYPIGNKLDALVQCGSDDENGISAIMDTDIACLTNFDIRDLLTEAGSADFAAAPIFGPQVFTLENRSLFDDLSDKLEIGGRVSMSPFPKRKEQLEAFNAGFVLTSSTAARTRWHGLTAQVLGDKRTPEKLRLPFADQVSLALLRADPRSKFTVLDNKWNRGHVPPESVPYFFHYHSFGVLLRHRFTNKILRKLIQKHKKGDTELLGELGLRDLFYFLEEKTIVSDKLP